MEPKIEVEKRKSTTDQETYYCSLCKKQLFVVGGYIQREVTFDNLFWGDPLLLLEQFRNGLKEKNYIKLIFTGAVIAWITFALCFVLFNFLLCI